MSEFQYLTDEQVRKLSLPEKDAYWWELSRQSELYVDLNHRD